MSDNDNNVFTTMDPVFNEMVNSGNTSKLRESLDNMGYDELNSVIENMEGLRRRYMQMFLDNRRDVDKECGYPDTEELRAEDYKNLYDREPIASRVVNIMPDSCWQVSPRVTDALGKDSSKSGSKGKSRSSKDKSPFDKAVESLTKNLEGPEIDYFYTERSNPLWEYLHRADRLCGVGRYGAILIGTSDGEKLNTPVTPGMFNGPDDLIYIRPLDETNARVISLETGDNIRRGKPTMYGVNLMGDSDLNVSPRYGSPSTDTTSQSSGTEVHWTRIVHIVDGVQSSPVFGVPRMQVGYNRLYDLHKLYGGSAEMYWQGALPGISFETQPTTGGRVHFDVSEMRNQIEQYFSRLQRWFALPGMTANTLSPQVVDPTAHIDAHIEALCIYLDVPKRIFMGSERGELASSQDANRWGLKVHFIQDRFLSPRIISPFINRLIWLGILPVPDKEQYKINWPDISTPTDDEKADLAIKRTQAIATYIGGNVSVLIDPYDYLTRVVGFTEDEANEIISNANAVNEDDSEIISKLEEVRGMVEQPMEGQQPGGKPDGPKSIKEQDGKAVKRKPSRSASSNGAKPKSKARART